jgi:hypothetical protein
VTKLDPTGPKMAHLALIRAQRRADRVRLNGVLESAAKGSFKANARHGDVKERVRVRRRHGRFLATTAPCERPAGGGSPSASAVAGAGKASACVRGSVSTPATRTDGQRCRQRSAEAAEVLTASLRNRRSQVRILSGALRKGPRAAPFRLRANPSPDELVPNSSRGWRRKKVGLLRQRHRHLLGIA